MNFKKYLSIIFISFLVLFGVNLLFSKDNVSQKSNFEIIDSLLKIFTDKFAVSQNFRANELISIDITQHPAKWLLRDKLLQVFSKYNCYMSSDSSSTANRFYEININDISVKYSINNLYPDSVNREILVHLTGLRRNTDKIEPIEEFNSTYKDIIARDNIESVNSKQYDFASSVIPVQEKTFFEEIIQPVILISSTIIAVVLLFTVRSN